MKRILLILLPLFFIGCSTKNVEYVLPTPNVTPIAKVSTIIGVADVKVPEYLNSDKILIQDGTKIKKIDAYFASTPSKLLTHSAIVGLKKSLLGAKVLNYPWDFKEKSGLVVNIYIDEFIYKDGFAIVSGSYYIKNANGGIVKNRNFKYSSASNSNTQEIVLTLSKLFDKVIEDIAINIAR